MTGRDDARLEGTGLEVKVGTGVEVIEVIIIEDAKSPVDVGTTAETGRAFTFKLTFGTLLRPDADWDPEEDGILTVCFEPGIRTGPCPAPT